MEENTVLCGANSYEQKYYFNQDFDSLPESVKRELQVMCVLYTEDVGGILTLEFEPDGNLESRSRRPRRTTSSTRSEACSRSSSTRRKSGNCWNRWSCTTVRFSWARTWISPRRRRRYET